MFGVPASSRSGRVAVGFRESWEGGDVYAMTSSDNGATWTSPVRLDAGDTGNNSFLGQLLVGSDGVVHAVFEQNRGAGTRVWYTRSTDGGLTFEPGEPVRKQAEPVMPQQFSRFLLHRFP